MLEYRRLETEENPHQFHAHASVGENRESCRIDCVIQTIWG